MRINNYTYPHSSFLAMEKDMSIICDLIIKNTRLQKLLYYTSKDAMNRPNLTEEQLSELFEKNIKTVPKIYVDEDVRCYVIISFDNFTPNTKNPEFRDNTLTFDIVCHYDQWDLGNLQLRPYRVAAEIDSMLKDKRLTGIGEVEFMTAGQIILSDEYAGLTLMYRTIHIGEDEKPMLRPEDQEQMVIDFNEMFNQ